MPLDLRKLHHATILAHERNFTKAAERLCITQPALSRSVTRLEAEMGFPIFDRNPGDVALTPLGKAFIERAQVLLEHSQALCNDMVLVKEGLSGAVAFGMTTYPAAVYLSKLTCLALHHQKGLNSRVEISSRETLLKRLNDEEIDFFVAGSNRFALGAQYSITPISQLRLSLYVRSRHPLASKAISSSSELLKFPLIGPIVAPSLLINFKYALKLPSLSSFQLTVSCDDINALKSMAMSSDAILISPHLALIDEYEKGEFEELKLVGALEDLTKGVSDICVIKLADAALSPAAEALVNQLIILAKR